MGTVVKSAPSIERQIQKSNTGRFFCVESSSVFIQRQQIDHLSYRQHFYQDDEIFGALVRPDRQLFFACGRPQLTGYVYDHHHSMDRITTGRLLSEMSDFGRLERQKTPFFSPGWYGKYPVNSALRSRDFVKFQYGFVFNFLLPAINWFPPRVRVVF